MTFSDSVVFLVFHYIKYRNDLYIMRYLLHQFFTLQEGIINKNRVFRSFFRQGNHMSAIFGVYYLSTFFFFFFLYTNTLTILLCIQTFFDLLYK